MLKELTKRALEVSHPVAGALHKGTNFKVLAIAFAPGTELKEHTASLPSKLFVVKGAVVYQQEELMHTLSLYDSVDIPAGMPHSVKALEESLCLLTQG